MKRDLSREIDFLSELEKLKIVYRYNRVIDQSRAENSAEHSWHLALMAVVFAPHAPHLELDLLKVIKMLLLHDIVEIDSGDVFLYNTTARDQSVENERIAAERIFGLLPEESGRELMGLWKEFEERQSPEAKFAASLDAFQPLLNHLLASKPHFNPDNMNLSAVIARKKHIADVSEDLWQIAQDLIAKSVEKGLYHPY
jgi:putative hydrolases of HD superfamily